MEKEMSYVQIGGLYRHFKTGGYYIVNDVATEESTDEVKVIYKSVETGIVYCRPYEEWFTDVSEREDNKFSQQTRFEMVSEIKSIVSLLSTQELVEELSKRGDNPYDSIVTLDKDPDVWDIKYLVGIVTPIFTESGEEVEEYRPSLQTFNTYEEAKRYRDRFKANGVIARRIIRKVEQ